MRIAASVRTASLVAGLVGSAILAGGIRTAWAAGDEIQVYLDDMSTPGEIGLDVHSELRAGRPHDAGLAGGAAARPRVPGDARVRLRGEAVARARPLPAPRARPGGILLRQRDQGSREGRAAAGSAGRLLLGRQRRARMRGPARERRALHRRAAPDRRLAERALAVGGKPDPGLHGRGALLGPGRARARRESGVPGLSRPHGRRRVLRRAGHALRSHPAGRAGAQHLRRRRLRGARRDPQPRRGLRLDRRLRPLGRQSDRRLRTAPAGR